MSGAKRLRPKNPFDTKACINCGLRFEVDTLRYWFGANEVGPFCETCDATVKLHTGFQERRSVAKKR